MLAQNFKYRGLIEYFESSKMLEFAEELAFQYLKLGEFDKLYNFLLLYDVFNPLLI